MPISITADQLEIRLNLPFASPNSIVHFFSNSYNQIKAKIKGQD